jgi:hypothetical protein
MVNVIHIDIQQHPGGAGLYQNGTRSIIDTGVAECLVPYSIYWPNRFDTRHHSHLLG